VSTGFIGCREGRVGNSQKFLDTSYARVAELVLGSTPAGTPGVVDGASWQPYYRAPLAPLTATPRPVGEPPSMPSAFFPRGVDARFVGGAALALQQSINNEALDGHGA
jgi:hypothetical protein